MSSRAEQLADEFDKVVSEFIEVVESCPDSRWTGARGEEGWNVAATAQHVSGQFPLEMEYITAAAEGRELPSYTWDDINSKNDSRASENEAVSKADVLSELREKGSAAAQYVRGLTDEQLDRKSKLELAGGADVTTQQLIEGGVLIDHVRSHTASIRAASEPETMAS